MIISLQDNIEQLKTIDSMHIKFNLKEYAQKLLESLPKEPVTLLTTSEVGLALSVQMLALHPYEESCWYKVAALKPVELPTDKPVYMVEVVDSGPVWREALGKNFPIEKFLIALAPELF